MNLSNCLVNMEFNAMRGTCGINTVAPSGLLYGFTAWHRASARCYTLIAPSGLLYGFIGLHRVDTRCYTL